MEQELKELEKFRGIKTLTPELAQKIYDAFGSCTALYECHTPKEPIADFEEDVKEDSNTDLAKWINIHLSVEDAFGTGSELIEEAKKRLARIPIRQVFHFFAAAPNTRPVDAPHLQFMATNVVDAWLNLEIYERNHIVAVAFKTGKVTAFDWRGNEIATRTWAEWHAELNRDTYGDDWESKLDHAASLMQQ